jgi:hypothetical protein
MADTVTTVRVPEDVLAEFEAIAERTGETRSDVMRRALIVGLDGIKHAHGALDNPLVGPLLEALVKSRTVWELTEGLGREAAKKRASEVGARVSNVRKSRGKKGGGA